MTMCVSHAAFQNIGTRTVAPANPAKIPSSMIQLLRNVFARKQPLTSATKIFAWPATPRQFGIQSSKLATTAQIVSFTTFLKVNVSAQAQHHT